MTSLSLNMFKIKLDNPTATYKSGGIISGQIIIDLAKSQKLKALKVKFKGQCLVRWSSKVFKFNSEDFFGHDLYFCEDICLFGEIGENVIELPSGHHIYPFKYVLPENIPNSFEHSIGCVKYSIKVIMDRPWSDYKTSKIFTVVSPSGTQLEECTSGIIDHKYIKNYSCIFPFITNGSLNYRIQLPKVMYSLGENIQAIVHLNNKSNSVQVTEIEMDLVQELKFYARIPYEKSISKINLIKSTSQTGPFDKKSNVTINMRIPFIIPLKLHHCKLIDISYQIYIFIHISGLHRKIKKMYNIFIGKNLSPQQSLPNSDSCGVSAQSNYSYITPVRCNLEETLPYSDDYPAQSANSTQYPSVNNQNMIYDNQIDAQYPSSSSTPYLARASPQRFSPRNNNSLYSSQPESDLSQYRPSVINPLRTNDIGCLDTKKFPTRQSPQWPTQFGETQYLQTTITSDSTSNYCISRSYETAMTLL
ncbi:arrestin domain-containing protein 17-like isoform X2 [Cotesia typhae]|uniref:arrestin domain-containing protein 17-like isoform X2 n=1 Tax=Cotesia typhae TaxID=2053667 RepID=UPI003D692BBE